jgi:hypothetical protein
MVGFVIKRRARHRRPAAFGADPVACFFVIRPELLTRLMAPLSIGGNMR